MQVICIEQRVPLKIPVGIDLRSAHSEWQRKVHLDWVVPAHMPVGYLLVGGALAIHLAFCGGDGEQSLV